MLDTITDSRYDQHAQAIFYKKHEQYHFHNPRQEGRNPWFRLKSRWDQTVLPAGMHLITPPPVSQPSRVRDSWWSACATGSCRCEAESSFDSPSQWLACTADLRSAAQRGSAPTLAASFALDEAIDHEMESIPPRTNPGFWNPREERMRAARGPAAPLCASAAPRHLAGPRDAAQGAAEP